jgi:hypothetical protein
MKIIEILERVGMTRTGVGLTYIKDALHEMNLKSETHVKTARINIDKDKRFYDLPKDVVKILSVRCKNQLNNSDEYRAIPRAIGNITSKDPDGK